MAVTRLKPKLDFVFGRLFGEKDSKESLLALLNAILRQQDGTDPIVDLTVIENKKLKKLLLGEKGGVLDIRAESSAGEQINVEMQMADHGNMVLRSLYYMGKMFVSSIKSGQDYSLLKRTIAINLLDFEQFPTDRFHTTYRLYEDHRDRTLLSDALEVHYIEFPKFERCRKDKDNPLHRWLMFLDEKLPEKELKELIELDPVIGKTEEKLEELSADEFMQQLAEARAKAQSDWVSSISAGERRGRAEGKAEGKAEVAERLLNKGMDLPFICEVTGLTESEVGLIRRQMK